MLYGCEKDSSRPVKQEQEHKMLFKPDSISSPAIILKPQGKFSKIDFILICKILDKEGVKLTNYFCGRVAKNFSCAFLDSTFTDK